MGSRLTLDPPGVGAGGRLSPDPILLGTVCFPGAPPMEITLITLWGHKLQGLSPCPWIRALKPASPR